ncbi:unnamed protein product, partial [Rotaria sp. Silwood2]
MSGTVCDGS